MKRFNYVLFVILFVLGLLVPIVSLQASWNWHQSPVDIVDEVRNKANALEEIQKTDLDHTTSKYSACVWIAPDSRFTLTRTLCHIKENIKDYLQYAMYIWLTVATILLIRNGFRIVTSDNREKEIWNFKTNLKYIVIWVVLLTWFYYIIDILIGVVNLFSD